MSTSTHEPRHGTAPDPDEVHAKLTVAVSRAIAAMNLAARDAFLVEVSPAVASGLAHHITFGAFATWRGYPIRVHPGPFDPSTKDDVRVTYNITRTETLT
jgi:hypothetical protein